MGKPEVKISKIVFIDLYVNQKKNGLEIARFFGIGRTTVSRYIKRYGLEKRGISEVRKNKKWSPTNKQVSALVNYNKAHTGPDNHAWKGDDVKYHGLHRWVEKQFPKPDLCEFCKEIPPKDLSNKGIYNRDLSNWQWLCRRCHVIYDGHTAERRAKQAASLRATRAKKYWSSAKKTS